jgi:hypothetical protein
MAVLVAQPPNQRAKGRVIETRPSYFCFVVVPQTVFKKYQFLERLTAQIQCWAINLLEGLGEGLALGVFGTLLKRTVYAPEGKPELLRDGS